MSATTRLRVNRKLTPLIAGLTIAAAALDGSRLTISFDDGSRMSVDTGSGTPVEQLLGRRISAARQGGALLVLLFQDGTAAPIPLAEATSSVLLRDARGVLLYAD